MHWKQLILLVAVFFSCGCNLIYYAGSNVIHNSALYLHSREIEHKASSLAKTAWKEYLVLHPEWVESKDFAEGFKDGYADFLINGGTGAPPAVPPKSYQSPKFMNPEGYKRIDLYFAGFVTGAQESKASGVRETLVVPVLAPLIPAPTDDPAGVYQPDNSAVKKSTPKLIETNPPELLPTPSSIPKQ